jgi:hypothetical protein
VALLFVSALGSGCVLGPRGVQQLANATLWTPALVGTAVILAMHDDHEHGADCGHYRRWHHDRWVYYYDGHWEYYEPATAAWYIFAQAR